MTHSTAVLFAHVGAWLLGLPPSDTRQKDEAKSPTPVLLAGDRDRLPPRDESFYWAWQYWSQ
ncbi:MULTISPECIES: hypothetical protein [unclassified Mesorhizobium]|uniref:hypothetical protein n=1 Tax=unclassified Mesorhizobium TaxID=325217 RepID=UPI000FDA6E62|nr:MULTISPECIES: hypothetical protein [unclassified Mesorhizobium]TGQ07818.1 hypothetical protein EN862_024800 [Mesorhizobium sp. M2E.F.Ca.ET.219.01.1.1]TGT73871.1 hypothetical protein EN809_013685 [Mesorhizobium sp. M2E.F.Ca.ET.166.01.1.1]TGW00385.1 hypothetical protein EN797_019865 [Mesorhizobium sp. M2E.F.Ca.ET.154.01.1.1]